MSGLLARVPESLRPIVALILNDDGTLTTDVVSLLRLHGISAKSLREAVPNTQYLRKMYPKAQDIPPDADDIYTAYQQFETRRLLDKLGQNGKTLVKPKSKYFKRIGLHEHWGLDALRRAETAGGAWDDGIRWERMAVLGCGMPVPAHKSIEHLMGAGLLPLGDDSVECSYSPSTWVGTIGWMLRHGNFPGEMRRLPIDLISTPFGRELGEIDWNYSNYPDTGDSVKAWYNAGRRLIACRGAGFPDSPMHLIPPQMEPDYPLREHRSEPDRWYWPEEGPLGDILTVSNGWQYTRQALLTWTELVKADSRFRNSEIVTISGAPGHAYSITVRLREFYGFLWALLHLLLKPHLGWEG